eukprot:2290381-Pleurochrysis_carterae.AAC.1
MCQAFIECVLCVLSASGLARLLRTSSVAGSSLDFESILSSVGGSRGASPRAYNGELSMVRALALLSPALTHIWMRACVHACFDLDSHFIARKHLHHGATQSGRSDTHGVI